MAGQSLFKDNVKYTYWYKYDHKSNEYKFNHMEPGYIDSRKPTPNSEEQENSWKDCQWAKEYLLENGEVKQSFTLKISENFNV